MPDTNATIADGPQASTRDLLALLREAARYLEAAADGESDYYCRTDYGPVPDGDPPHWGEVIGRGPSGFDLADGLREYADALAARLPPDE